MWERCIANFDTGKRFLRYTPSTGEYQDIEHDKLPTDSKISLGFYVNVDQDVVGVYASPHGPVCFHNHNQYPLVLTSWNATVISEDEHDLTIGQNTFTLFHNGRKAFAVSYEAPLYRYYDIWSSDDEDVDFFLWLKSKVENLRFHTFYTKSWDFGRSDLLPPAQRT